MVGYTKPWIGKGTRDRQGKREEEEKCQNDLTEKQIQLSNILEYH